MPLPVLSNYLESEIMALLKRWLDCNMLYPPERMDEIFHELVVRGIRSASKLTDRGGCEIEDN